jgi:quercetin dioxygenase-like cupin family protein
VQVIKLGKGTPVWSTHNSDIHFTFVLDGSLTLEGGDQLAQHLVAGDAFVIPPGMQFRYNTPSRDVSLLEVSLPGDVETEFL